MLARWMAAVLALALVPGCAPAAGGGVSRVAPPFELPSLDGGKVSLASLRGKVVVLDFWATWCGPCIAEMPEYVAFQKKNRARGVEVVGVALESEPEDVQQLVREHRVDYRQLIGNEQLQEAYDATQGLPTTFVIDREGRIREKVLGSPPGKFDKLQKTVDAALGS